MFCLASLYERICQDLQEKMLHRLAQLNSQAVITRPADFCEENLLWEYAYCRNSLQTAQRRSALYAKCIPGNDLPEGWQKTGPEF